MSSNANTFNVIFSVYQVAFHKGGPVKVRKVAVPEGELAYLDLTDGDDMDKALDLIYRYGQNDVQPQDTYSVSCGSLGCGDVIGMMVDKEGDGSAQLQRFEVAAEGFVAFNGDLQAEADAVAAEGERRFEHFLAKATNEAEAFPEE